MKLIQNTIDISVKEKDIEKFMPQILASFETMDKTEIIKKFVSAEFNRFLDYYKNSSDINNKSINTENSHNKKRKSHSDSFINFSVNIGRKNGVSPIELISLINRALKSNEVEIGGIDIRESYTIFEIDGLVKKDLLKKIKKVDFNGNSISIKETKEKIEKKFSKDKKRKKHSSGRRNRNSFDKDKSMGNFRSKRKNKKKNKKQFVPKHF